MSNGVGGFLFDLSSKNMYYIIITITKENKMPFTIDTRNIINHQKVCYKKKTKEGYPYSDATYHLAWGSMAIGIGEITKKNYAEVYARHKFLNKLSRYGIPFNLTIENVYSHIGLKTNVSPETKSAWRNRIAKSCWQEITYDIEKKVNNIKEIDSYGGTV
jgi:hypothetical protein